MKAKPKPKRGRPAKPAGEKFRKVLVSIESTDDEIALALGRGDRSKGIRLALRAASVTAQP